MEERREQKKNSLISSNDNNGIPSLNSQNLYSPNASMGTENTWLRSVEKLRELFH